MPNAQLEARIDLEVRPDVIGVGFTGRLTGEAATKLMESDLAALVESPARSGTSPSYVVIDFHNVEWMTHADVGRLIALRANLATAHRRLILLGVTPELRELLDIAIQPPLLYSADEQELRQVIENPANTGPIPRDQIESRNGKIDPEILEWARSQFNEEDMLAEIRLIEEGGGKPLSEFIDELEKRATS